MSVRFVVGRAGSGKTHHCLEAIRQRLRRRPLDGPSLLLLVPEQASFQMEQALVATPDLPGFLRCEVLSFQRLAYRVFAETGLDPRRGDQTIGQLGRLMVLRRLISNSRHRLTLLGSVADKPGLVKQVAGTLDELMRENIAPAMLLQLADQRCDADPLAAAKLRDLNTVYEDYLGYLQKDRVDPAQYLTLAAEHLAKSAWLTGAEIWVDGFAGFTQQEQEMLVVLAKRAANMDIALLVDGQASALHSDDLPALNYSLFARTERTLVRLKQLFRTAGVEIQPPLVLPLAEAPVAREATVQTRFRRTALARLEKHLFGTPPAEPCDCSGVQVNRLPDHRLEVEAAVAEIERLTKGPGATMRYRDIAVIVRDLKIYEDLVTAQFKSRGIPCFVDRRQSTTHSPLVELVRGLLAVAADDCRLQSVRLMLKTGLLPISRRNVDLLETYLLAHGIQGRGQWCKPWSYTRIFGKRRHSGLSKHQEMVLEQVNLIREAWLEVVDPWLAASRETPADAGVRPGDAARRSPGCRSGREWAGALFACLERSGVVKQMQEWAEADEKDGMVDEALMHKQVWVDFLDLLDEFVHALGEEQMDIHGFRETIEAGLAEFDLGLAPPTLDQVLVGSIERSRQPELRAAFVLGFDHAHYPLERSEDPLLGDAERELLESTGRSVGASRRRQVLDERMLVYILLTRASEYLWLSYPGTKADGSPCEPSVFLRQVLETLPGLTVNVVDDPRQSHKPLWLNRVAELGARLAATLRARPRLSEEIDSEGRAVWNGLYEACRHRPEWHKTLRSCLAGLGYENRPVLSPQLIEAFYKQQPAFSVSRLERFAACPFAHFVDYMLRLESRVEAELEPLDVGNFCHLILEKFFDELMRANIRLSDLESHEIEERIAAVMKELSPRMTDQLLLADARNAYVSQWARRHVLRVSEWQQASARAGKLRTFQVEFPFGKIDNSTTRFTLQTPGGRTIELCGRIDRVDVADLAGELLGVVIDYKASKNVRTLDLPKLYHGLSMQLVAYMLALQQVRESLTGRLIRPVAAFYLPLLERFEKVEHPDTEREEIRWRGVIDVAGLDVLDSGARQACKSRFYSSDFTMKNQPKKTSDLVTADQLNGILKHVGKVMGELADRLLDGDISAYPYRLNKQTACGFCKYKSICCFEIETQTPHDLTSYKKPEVLDLITLAPAAATGPAEKEPESAASNSTSPKRSNKTKGKSQGGSR